MIQMLKRDFYLNRMVIGIYILFVPLIYIMNTDPFYIYGGATTGLVFNVFFYDNKNHITRFISSLPVNKKAIVFGRYLFLLFAIVIILFYQWLIDSIAHNGLSYLDAEPITPAKIGLIFLSISVTAAIAIPAFYFFESIMKATIFLFILLFVVAFSMAVISELINFIPSVTDTLNQMPVFIPVLSALICLYASFKLSSWIFARKDII